MSDTWMRRLALGLALACFAGVMDLTAQQIELVPFAGPVELPVYLTHAGDGSGRTFLVSRRGQILVHDGTSILAQPFLDIESDVLSNSSEQGLLSVAFHPNYESNGYFFVNYTGHGPVAGNTVVERFQVSAGNPNVADKNSRLRLFSIPQPFANHNGGQLQFGPDGYLYIGMGDGGSGGDPDNRAQTMSTPLGKMLRIDVNQPPYAIPPQNPFVGAPGADERIWALGLRNPWRFSFDRLRGDLFIADVGQGSREEVNRQGPASNGGENYMWSCMEGTEVYDDDRECTEGIATAPILDYSHSLGCSITGGYVYRSWRYPTLQATYFYGDYCSGRIWGARQIGGGWTTTELLDTNFSITSFGEDERGELYVTDYSNDTFHRLKDARCTLDLDLAYDSGTLHIDFTVGSQQPSRIIGWVASQFGLSPFFIRPMPVLDPPVEYNAQLPVPQIGTVAVLSVITDANDQPLCVDIKAVDTGGIPHNGEAVGGIVREQWEHSSLLPPRKGISHRRGIF